MSTRSGKRIHMSFHEDTVKSEIDFTKSERKTRSKHTKENFNETNVSPKVKKRHYVAYPGDDEGVDTVDGEERTVRALRKNALKERNTASSTESVEPPVDSRKSVRSTRRTRKFDENSQDTPAVLPQDAEPTEIDLPKPKKSKKKKKAKQEVEETEAVEVKVPKKKSKKKKERRSGSMVVEDIVQEASNGLNKSNMSIDSFHSAAGSPRNGRNDECLSQINHDTVAAVENDSPKTATRKTRSSVKLDYTQDMTVKESKIKASVKECTNDSTIENEIENEVDTSTKSRKRKSSNRETAVSDTNETQNLIEVVKLNTSRKSIRNATIEKTPTKNNCIASEAKEGKTNSSRKSKRNSIAKENNIEDTKPIEDTLNTTFEELNELSHRKKRKSSIRVTDISSPIKNKNRKSVINGTEKDLQELNPKMNTDATFNLSNSSPRPLADENFKFTINTTIDKDLNTSQTHYEKEKSVIDMTLDVTSSPFKSAVEISSPMTTDDSKGTSINTTYEKDNAELNDKPVNTTFDKDTETKINTTFETDKAIKRKSLLRLSSQKIADSDVNSTFNVDQEKKLDTTFDKNSKLSLISSDNSMITLDKSDASRISITSDESKNEENILNTTPLLIESSMDESVINTTKTPTKDTTLKETVPVTPLKREGTFTKDEPEVTLPVTVSKTPTKRMSLPSPGFTPFHVNKSSSKEKSVLNVTRSVEKRSSLAEPRTTKVMFCSPVNNPALVTQIRRKVIKSNLKGSNKSFVFDESASLDSLPPNRKRSYTQSDADDARVKRKRLADGLQQSVDRLSRPRTSSASAKLAEPTTPSKKPITPKKLEAKTSRTKLPNFAALHQKQFSKMESLDECQERKAKRAKQLLTPTGAVNMLERISPKDKAIEPEKKEAPEKAKDDPKKPETPIKSLPTFKSLNPGYTRFGFKLNLDVNPFSIPSKTQPKPKDNKPNGLTRQPTLPSLAGATSMRREVAKQTVMREKSFTDRRSVKRTENRTVIKGVRTNRRFELQMRMRDI